MPVPGTKARRTAVVFLAWVCACACAGTTEPELEYATVAADAPPPPRIEVLPPAPGPSRVWINGYWYPTPHGFAWVAGHWALRPGPEYVWRRSGWVRYRRGYRFYPGRWVLNDEGPPPPFLYPPPLWRGLLGTDARGAGGDDAAPRAAAAGAAYRRGCRGGAHASS